MTIKEIQEIKDRLGWHEHRGDHHIEFLIEEIMNICDLLIKIQSDNKNMNVIIENWDEKIKNGEFK